MVPLNSLNIIIRPEAYSQSDELEPDELEDKPLNSFFYKKRHEIQKRN